MPAQDSTFYAAMIGVCALCGAGVSLSRRCSCCATAGPIICRITSATACCRLAGYVALIVAAGLIYIRHEIALDVLAIALLVLLVINIRNAWDLTLSMARRHGSGRPEP